MAWVPSLVSSEVMSKISLIFLPVHRWLKNSYIKLSRYEQLIGDWIHSTYMAKWMNLAVRLDRNPRLQILKYITVTSTIVKYL